ncbi:hypothetical protein BCR36DRAFT_407632 [Piromyces finnis]|uniref:Uncharacterized protein n=1 Tax=Piromyces finnis TaxID=1754191 RepID=A0A1Y1UPT1_9FUNG|nr:hypothetical protein BCR36DRAFT_407632 [Piromyces finnis]|eukprot:ORX39466.1 hypothetical protein BCR36DRAFT_407632 [Piromyces finnis]
MIAHPPLNSMKSNYKMNNIRKKNYTKKKSSSNEPKKKISEIEKLEIENQEMEQRLLELKQNLAKEKEKRLKQGKTSFWQSGKKGVLFNHGNEVIYNKNLNQMKNKDSIYGISLQNTSSGMLKNKGIYDPMRYLNLNNNRKNTLNLINTSSSIKKPEPNKNSKTTITTNNVNDSKQHNNPVKQNGQIEIESDKNNEIILKKKTGGLFNFNKYLDNSIDQLNSISLSSPDDTTIIKSKYDEAMKSKTLVENQDTKVNSGSNTSSNEYIYPSNYKSSQKQQNDDSRLIDGEFNEEESHNSFVEALNLWRKERREQEISNVNKKKEIKPSVVFAENYNDMNSFETQTKELNNALNMDEIIKNLQESKSNLSYMERLALHKYREQYKKEMEEGQKPKLEILKKDIKIVDDIDEDEIDAEVEKYWEDNNKETDNENDIEKEIENNLNTYVNQYKMKQLELYKYNKGLNAYNSRMNNTKTSVYIEDSFSDEDENEIIEFNDVSPIVDEPDEIN